MSFTSIGALLPQAVRHAGVDTSVTAAKVVEIAVAAGSVLFPPEQMRFIHPVSFVEGVLRVAITSPSAGHAIRLRGTKWIEEMNRQIGTKKVKTIGVKRQGF
jgi:hypothetical protein